MSEQTPAMPTKKLYQLLGSLVEVAVNAPGFVPLDRVKAARDDLEFLVRNYLPSGSGWDVGTRIDWNATRKNKIVLLGSFHHMDEYGGYDGWTDHTVVVTPDFLSGYHVRVTGRDKNDILDFITELFDYCLGRTFSCTYDSEARKIVYALVKED